MVLRVKPTPTRFPINSLYIPIDNTPLHPLSSVCLRGVYGKNMLTQKCCVLGLFCSTHLTTFWSITPLRPVPDWWTYITSKNFLQTEIQQCASLKASKPSFEEKLERYLPAK